MISVIPLLLFLPFYIHQTNSQDALTFDETQFVPVDSPVAGSPASLKALAEKEEIIYILVSHYLEKSPFDETPVSELAKRYIAYFDATTGKLKLNFRGEGETSSYRPYNAAWNPLSVFHFLKRFLGIVKDIVRNLDPRNKFDYALQKQILHLMQNVGWPTEADLDETMSAILRIQHTYDLTTADIASGILKGTDTGVVLSPLDCNAIGMYAIEAQYYALAVEWLELSVASLDSDIPVYESETDMDGVIFQTNLDYAIEMHDWAYDTTEDWEPKFFSEKVEDSPKNKVRRRTAQLEYWKGNRSSDLISVNYWGVCSGENYQSEEQKSKLFCWYETKSHPYWSINPLKAEWLSYDPLEIVQYHELIGSKMIDQIKADATFRMVRSEVVDETPISDKRTSLNTWIEDNNIDSFRSIGGTMELITGLRVSNDSASEFLQVATYSSGSHYETHLDAQMDDQLNDYTWQFGEQQDETGAYLTEGIGDRIATFIFYLSEVGQGGGTAFPQSGIATVPLKGSAVLWYNILRSGQVDDFSWHGACPVILGEKWIANKWIRSNDQMFSQDYNCLPEEDARFEMKVNGVPLRALV